ncbi:MAG: flagellar hook-basal body complex protein FliE [Acidobacteria bacterium]|nr:flagellar hook-basal body complex protein FliE [Acidobacteriota bacterium]
MNPAAISAIIKPALISLPETASAESGGSFADLLSEATNRLSEVQNHADQELRSLLAGESVDLHRVLLAGEQAGLASQLMMSVRNKVVDAYQEIMRMQV